METKKYLKLEIKTQYVKIWGIQMRHYLEQNLQH